MILDDYNRVRRGLPCPICGKTSWCLVAKDDSGNAICKRVESSKSYGDAGWFHGTARPTDRRIERRPSSPSGLSLRELQEYAGRFAAGMDGRRREHLANALNVSAESLERLQVGFDGEAYSFPMFSGTGVITGFRLRLRDGRKLSLTGSKEGLFIPEGLSRDSTLHLCEGPTSCAALLTMGFDAIGRPSCNGGVVHLKRWLHGQNKRNVIVWGDHDSGKSLPKGGVFYPGQDGARKTALEIEPLCRSVQVFIPDSVKDAREWLRVGATRAVIEAAIADS